MEKYIEKFIIFIIFSVTALVIFGVVKLQIHFNKSIEEDERRKEEMGCEYYRDYRVQWLPVKCLEYFNVK